jgi:hypothetical protein
MSGGVTESTLGGLHQPLLGGQEADKSFCAKWAQSWRDLWALPGGSIACFFRALGVATVVPELIVCGVLACRGSSRPNERQSSEAGGARRSVEPRPVVLDLRPRTGPAVDYAQVTGERHQLAVVRNRANEAFPMYRSSGDNSHHSDTWFPFEGRVKQGMYLKPHFHEPATQEQDFAERFGDLAPIITRDPVLGGEDLDYQLFCRFGSPEGACLSARIGGGYWETREGQHLEALLRERMPEHFEGGLFRLTPTQDNGGVVPPDGVNQYLIRRGYEINEGFLSDTDKRMLAEQRPLVTA